MGPNAILGNDLEQVGDIRAHRHVPVEVEHAVEPIQ